MAKKRLFLAIELPPRVIDVLKRLQIELKRVFPDARMANPAGMHLTVKFIGYAEESEIPAIAEAARRAADETRPFALELSGFGGFPSLARPRVLWAGASDNGESAALSAALDRELSGLGVKSETRPYKPHVTLARINKPPHAVPERLVAAAALSEHIGTARAEKLILFESHLLRGGAEYEALEEFDFQP